MDKIELIDRVAVIEALEFSKTIRHMQANVPLIDEFIGILNDAPTIDAAPVRRGEWGVSEIVGYDGVNAVYAAPCSACGEFSKEARLFCPNCGAKMGKEEHHE